MQNLILTLLPLIEGGGVLLMTSSKSLFKSLVIEENPDGSFSSLIKKKSVEDLPVGELLIKVSYSSLNYKDALACSGAKGVVRSYPFTPGIDVAGKIIEYQEEKIQTSDTSKPMDI